jgi:hypothetical protein
MSDDIRPCICGCGQPQRTRSTWLNPDARMFATIQCEQRWSHGLATCPCGRDFAGFLGGRVGSDLLCPQCYESHPAIVGEQTAKVKAWEAEDEFQKVRRA